MSLAVENKARGRRVSARKEVTEQLRIRNSFERRLTFQMMTWYAEMAEAASREYLRNPTKNVSIPQAERSLNAVLLPHYQAVIETMAKRFNTLQRKQEEPWNRYYREYITLQGSEAVTNISSSTRLRLKRLVEKGLDEGMGQAELAKNIVDKFQPQFTRARAKVVARTETHSAASFANHKMASDIDAKLVKRWVATNDIRTRSHHAAANGQEVPMDEDFTVITNGVPVKMGYTGDPRGGALNVINCRCITIYVEPEDMIVDDQPKPKPQETDFGDTTEEELLAHQTSFPKGTPEVFLEVIRRTQRASVTFDTRASGSYYHPLDNDITMRFKKSDQLPQSYSAAVFRHEYGHFADYNRSLEQDEYRPVSRKVIVGMNKDTKKNYTPEAQKRANDEFEKDLGELREKNDGFLGVASEQDVLKVADSLGLDENDLKVLSNNKDWRETKGRRYQMWTRLSAIKHRDIKTLDDDYLNANNVHPANHNIFLADFLGSMTNRKVGWGHTKKYYQQFPPLALDMTVGHTTEVMANYWALIGSQEHQTWRKIIKHLAPETLSRLDGAIAQMAEGGKI